MSKDASVALGLSADTMDRSASRLRSELGLRLLSASFLERRGMTEAARAMRENVIEPLDCLVVAYEKLAKKMREGAENGA